MSYISPSLTNLIAAVKKSAASLGRDFSEIEKLQSSVRDYRNFVINAYNKVERTLKTELSRFRPGYVFAEDNKPLPEGWSFIVSPLNGLTNFVRGIPYFSVSVAICENGTVVSSVIYNPVLDELYFAEKGMGAYKEGFRSHERLRVSARKELAEAVAFIDSEDAKEENADNIRLRSRIESNVSATRLWGDSALELAALASGKADIFVGMSLLPSRIAAGMLLVKEAGGYIYELGQKDIRTEDLSAVLNGGNIWAVNANLNNRLYDLLNK